MKKKIITAMIVCMLCMVSILCLCACNHEHTYAEEWSSDDTNHWHESTCGHDVKKDEGRTAATLVRHADMLKAQRDSYIL